MIGELSAVDILQVVLAANDWQESVDERVPESAAGKLGGVIVNKI